MKRVAALVVGCALFACLAISAQQVEQKKAPDALGKAFNQLKAMAGKWKVSTKEKSDLPENAVIEYRVTGGGSAVIETMFPGEKMEMVSIYHRDGDKLVMTHYCAAGNQPRFQARIDGQTGDLVFEFAGGCNLDPAKDMHVHGGRIRFIDADTAESTWDFYAGGKSLGAHTFQLNRVK